MAKRARSICRKNGCNELIPAPGYCIEHTIEKKEKVRSYFKKLDEKKPESKRKFYATNRWRKTSERHRRNNPLCGVCRERDRITLGTLTHHKPSLDYLLSNKLDPYSSKYLQTLCDRCHLEELRAKRGK